MKIWRMRIACWIRKAKNTPTVYHCKKYCTIATQCYVIRTLTVLLIPNNMGTVTEIQVLGPITKVRALFTAGT